MGAILGFLIGVGTIAAGIWVYYTFLGGKGRAA